LSSILWLASFQVFASVWLTKLIGYDPASLWNQSPTVRENIEASWGLRSFRILRCVEW